MKPTLVDYVRKNYRGSGNAHGKDTFPLRQALNDQSSQTFRKALRNPSSSTSLQNSSSSTSLQRIDPSFSALVAAVAAAMDRPAEEGKGASQETEDEKERQG